MGMGMGKVSLGLCSFGGGVFGDCGGRWGVRGDLVMNLN